MSSIARPGRHLTFPTSCLRGQTTVRLEQATQFLNDGLAVQPAFLNHRADTLVEPRLLSSRERFGREHDDRDLMKLRGLLNLLDGMNPSMRGIRMSFERRMTSRVKPIMAFIGVRSSGDMLARNQTCLGGGFGRFFRLL